ncbi:hypothetical protein [Microbispora bryophytorum]|nr:hypothetical protein [Microbispora camponoti]
MACLTSSGSNPSSANTVFTGTCERVCPLEAIFHEDDVPVA